MEARQAFLRLGIDAATLLALSAGFLQLYVGRYDLPASAIQPHLHLVGLTLAAFALARIALAALTRAPNVQRLGTAVLATSLLTTVAVYYTAVLLGLEYWGNVISWQLMTSYAAQTPELVETLGFPIHSIAAATVLACLAIAAVAWLYVRHDWAPALARRIPVRILWVAAPAAASMIAVGFYNFLAAPPTHLYEPVSLTFFPSAGKWKIHGYAIDAVSAERLDRQADAARASYVPSNDVDRKNVVLIVADALRPDHMGVYGYKRDTTPGLSALDRGGKVRRASSVYAVCASSACGLVGLASSRFVHEFHPRAISLHEVLQRHGYRVHLVLSGDHTNFYGLKLAYSAVDSYFDGSAAPDRNMNDDRILLDRLAGFPDWDGAPVMFQFHLMSTHVLGKRDGATSRFLPAANYARSEGRSGGLGINFYDNGVAQADAIVNELLRNLESKGYLRNAVVVITADHGECLGEHGLYLHANHVREPALRIPFLLLSYGYAPGRTIDGHAVASQVDIAPTILAELGFPQPATWSGTPLQSPGPRVITSFQERSDIGIIDHRDPENVWKYWFNTGTRREYAFNLSVDPGEAVNALDRVPRERLREWRRRALIGVKVEKGPGA